MNPTDYYRVRLEGAVKSIVGYAEGLQSGLDLQKKQTEVTWENYSESIEERNELKLKIADLHGVMDTMQGTIDRLERENGTMREAVNELRDDAANRLAYLFDLEEFMVRNKPQHLFGEDRDLWYDVYAAVRTRGE